MGGGHDSHEGDHAEPIIPLGSTQDRFLMLLSFLCIGGLFLWGYQLCLPVTTAAEPGHGGNHQGAESTHGSGHGAAAGPGAQESHAQPDGHEGPASDSSSGPGSGDASAEPPSQAGEEMMLPEGAHESGAPASQPGKDESTEPSAHPGSPAENGH